MKQSKSLFEQTGLDVLAESKGYESWEDYTQALRGNRVIVGNCFEGQSHAGKEGTVSGFDGDFVIVDFDNGDWCMATELSTT